MKPREFSSRLVSSRYSCRSLLPLAASFLAGAQQANVSLHLPAEELRGQRLTCCWPVSSRLWAAAAAAAAASSAQLRASSSGAQTNGAQLALSSSNSNSNSSSSSNSGSGCPSLGAHFAPAKIVSLKSPPISSCPPLAELGPAHIGAAKPSFARSPRFLSLRPSQARAAHGAAS